MGGVRTSIIGRPRPCPAHRRAVTWSRHHYTLNCDEPDRLDELQHRLDAALAARDFPVDDVEAGRRYIATYVAFLTYAEGEEHHHGDHEHGPVEHAHRH